jgi:hypothetical protein
LYLDVVVAEVFVYARGRATVMEEGRGAGIAAAAEETGSSDIDDSRGDRRSRERAVE